MRLKADVRNSWKADVAVDRYVGHLRRLALSCKESVVSLGSCFPRAVSVVLFCSATCVLAQTGTVNDFAGGLVPNGKNGPELVGWRSVPTPAAISNVFPKGATKSGYMLWECQVQIDGRLTACALETQWPPNDDRYKVAAEKLLPLFRVDDETVRQARREGKAILFSLPVYRPDSKSFTAYECPERFCTPVPPPPKP